MTNGRVGRTMPAGHARHSGQSESMSVRFRVRSKSLTAKLVILLSTCFFMIQSAFSGDLTQRAAFDESVAAANELLGHGDRSNRVFVPLLSARFDRLCNFLQTFEIHVRSNTPVDIIVFSVDNKAANSSDCLSELRFTVHYLPLTEQWLTPSQAGDQSLWEGGGFSEDYRRMGHWRLVFPIKLAKVLGYKWYWQLDDDSSIDSMIPYNIVEWATERGLHMGAHQIASDPHLFSWGLPELARYFLVAEKLVPMGSLLDHCSPSSLEGLYTIREANGVPDDSGWDRTYLYGNCVLVNVDFWLRADVQRFVNLAVSSGGHFRFRWNEQGVMAMVWQIFVAPNQFALLDIPGYHHGHA